MPAGVFDLINKRTIRSTPNPLDKATIVSIFPLEITEFKHTVQPGYFHIPAGSIKSPSTLVVGPSSWWRDIGEEMPLIEIPNSAVVVAEAVVRDYCNGLLLADQTKGPGLFFIPGDHPVDIILNEYATAFASAVERQKAWFEMLVRLGDVGWADTNGNPNAISGLMRLAAEETGQTDRDWMKSSVAMNKVKCIACGNLRNPDFPVCSACNRIVDIALATKLGVMEPSKYQAVPVK